MVKVGSLNVIEKLQNNEDEHVKMQAIYYLKNAKQYFKTCFSDGTNPALNIQEKATILQVKGLDMPKADDDTSSYSTSEKMGLH